MTNNTPWHGWTISEPDIYWKGSVNGFKGTAEIRQGYNGYPDVIEISIADREYKAKRMGYQALELIALAQKHLDRMANETP